MYRASTTSSHPSSKSSCPHTSVCIVCPNFYFFSYFASIDSDPEEFDPAILPKSVFDAIEADSFWCLSRLLDGIQDNYIFAQPGIQRSVRKMAELVARIDSELKLFSPPEPANLVIEPLSSHLEAQNVEFMQFAFRWMNCLLMREISVQNTIRMWDTYLVRGIHHFNSSIQSSFILLLRPKVPMRFPSSIYMFVPPFL